MHPPKSLVESYPESWDSRPYRGQAGYIPHPRPHAGYAAMISDLDDNVAAVMSSLVTHGLDDNTIVIFTSDNGTTRESDADPVFGVGGVDAAFFNSTADLRGFKASVYEGGLRVPLIIRWPNMIEAGSISDLPTHAVDLFATLREIVNGESSNEIDGVSLLPTLTRIGNQVSRSPMIWVFTGHGGQVATRFDDWKLVRRNLFKLDTKPSSWELYDLAIDAQELNNVAAENPDVVDRGIEILREQIDENMDFPIFIPGADS